MFIFSCNQNKYQSLERDERLSRYFDFEELDNNPGNSILVSIKGGMIKSNIDLFG